MRSSIGWLGLATLLAPANALYFFLDSNTQRCFYEELPKDTLVVAHYKTELWNEQTRAYSVNEQVGIQITVDEVFDNDHRIIKNTGSHQGRFTFTAADSGDHKICFTPSNAATSHGWLSGGMAAGAVKLDLDIAIGETSRIERTDKSKMTDIESKVKDLNARLQDIRREQVFQREREAEFRDQSESTNARVVRWTLIQLAVLGITCAWQLSHLRAFFIKQKLT
ncbi:MAG: emp24p/erv25p- protein [Bathelium mastoideum]|nr:MAG: emp24p/erv25p- protein [Bathelium mastoideum]KAI9686571.1 MAG: emp24p/erv25p- protein [Bathelium mastoideum]